MSSQLLLPDSRGQRCGGVCRRMDLSEFDPAVSHEGQPRRRSSCVGAHVHVAPAPAARAHTLAGLAYRSSDVFGSEPLRTVPIGRLPSNALHTSTCTSTKAKWRAFGRLPSAPSSVPDLRPTTVVHSTPGNGFKGARLGGSALARVHVPRNSALHARLARTLSHQSSGLPMHRRTSLTFQPESVSTDRRAGSRQYVSM